MVKARGWGALGLVKPLRDGVRCCPSPPSEGLGAGAPRGAVLRNPLCTGKWKISPRPFQAPLTTWHLHSGTQAQTPISLESSMITSCKSVFWPALSSVPVNMPYLPPSSLSPLPRGVLLGREQLLLIRADRRNTLATVPEPHRESSRALRKHSIHTRELSRSLAAGVRIQSLH